MNTDANDTSKRLIGYVRTACSADNGDQQLAALKDAGCVEVFCDRTVPGTSAPRDRPGFKDAFLSLGRNDVLVVSSLSVLARDLAHLIAVSQALESKGVSLFALEESV